MGRIPTAAVNDQPAAVGRPLTLDHHLSARLWATAALLSALLPASERLGWWLPLHLALVGTVTQLIVGEQLRFSATIGPVAAPGREQTLPQLALLNLGALAIVVGRWAGADAVAGAGGATLLAGVAWAGLRVHLLWRRSPNRRFAATATTYRLAHVNILIGGSLGAALALGMFKDPTQYMSHKLAHMGYNLIGWAGLTFVGTVITFLPTVLHVRGASPRGLRASAYAISLGLAAIGAGLTYEVGPLALAGGLALIGAALPVALMVARVLRTPRRRQVPLAGKHLGAALVWSGTVTVLQLPALARLDLAALRNLWVVGLALGTIVQAVLGAWAFLLPAGRPPVPAQRRRELVAFEVAGNAQVVAYNLGAVLLLGEVSGLMPGPLGAVGLALLWAAAALAIIKAWSFPRLAELPSVQRRSEIWWAAPEAELSGARGRASV